MQATDCFTSSLYRSFCIVAVGCFQGGLLGAKLMRRSHRPDPSTQSQKNPAGLQSNEDYDSDQEFFSNTAEPQSPSQSSTPSSASVISQPELVDPAELQYQLQQAEQQRLRCGRQHQHLVQLVEAAKTQATESCEEVQQRVGSWHTAMWLVVHMMWRLWRVGLLPDAEVCFFVSCLFMRHSLSNTACTDSSIQ